MAEKIAKYMRIEAACEIFGCGRKKMRQMAMDAGALYKIDKTLLIDIKKVEDYIQEFFLVTEE